MATTAHRGVAIGILLFATFMDLLDVTMVQVALPAVGADLQASEDSLDWVVSGYMLAFAMGLVTGGRLGDILGRKRIFLMGTVGFTLASVVCTTAWTVEVLVAARVLQGLFAAIMVPQLLPACRVCSPRERTPGTASSVPAPDRCGRRTIAGGVLVDGSGVQAHHLPDERAHRACHRDTRKHVRARNPFPASAAWTCLASCCSAPRCCAAWFHWSRGGRWAGRPGCGFPSQRVEVY